MTVEPKIIDDVEQLLAAQNYVADRSLAIVVFLALRMQRPLLLEGEAGVGKTEIANVLAAGLNRPLIRLQCYEGLDLASAAYEWNHAAQMIEIRLAEASGATEHEQLVNSLYDQRFLMPRPLLRAASGALGRAPVLLIDELDRADPAFEAFLLEFLADFQITIPEIGAIQAPEPPIVVITSNRTREIHDAVKRRCLYHWVDYPDTAREAAILSAKVAQATPQLVGQITQYLQALRNMELYKPPGVAEGIDWANALIELCALELSQEVVDDTIGVLLKYQDDIALVHAQKEQIEQAIKSSANEKA